MNNQLSIFRQVLPLQNAANTAIYFLIIFFILTPIGYVRIRQNILTLVNIVDKLLISILFIQMDIFLIK